MSDHDFIDLLVKQANESAQYRKSLSAQLEDAHRYIDELKHAVRYFGEQVDKLKGL